MTIKSSGTTSPTARNGNRPTGDRSAGLAVPQLKKKRLEHEFILFSVLNFISFFYHFSLTVMDFFLFYVGVVEKIISFA